MASTMPARTEVPSDELFNELGQDYEDAFAHDAGLLDIIQHLLELLPPQANVLDCGSGTGKPVAYTISNSGHRLHGIDVAQNMVDLARKKVPNATFEKASMLEYKPTNLLDGVIAMFSLFQLTRKDITSMAHKWYGWLQPGGLLLLGIIAAEDCNLDSKVFDSDGKCATGVQTWFMKRPISVTLFTKAGWNDLLEDMGFELLHTKISAFAPPPNSGAAQETHYFIIARKP
ncbi:MAG: hypothetical protein LQ342_005804 [Letrouitia transgressa]|nr:MAG: hypothetical protein LQ342_005804 [Letrouitia transgressa]